MSAPHSPTIHLQPPPIPPNALQKFTDSNRAIKSALSPSAAELGVWIAPRDHTVARIKTRPGATPAEDDLGAASPLVQIGGKRPYGHFVDEVPRKKTQGVFEQDTAVYFGQYRSTDASLNKLYTDSHAIFSSLQTLYKSHIRLTIATRQPENPLKPLEGFNGRSMGATSPSTAGTNAFSFLPQPSLTLMQSKFAGSVQDGLRPGRQQIIYYRKIMDEYVARLEDVVKDVRLEYHLRARQHAILRTLQLASTLYVPLDGQGLSVVGEELLDWYNGYYDPDGAANVKNLVENVMLMRREWEHQDYEEAVVRTILRGFKGMTIHLLSTLKAHAQPSVVAFSQILVNATNTLPRSNNTATYPTELAFVAAHAKWRGGVKAQITAFTRARERVGGWLEFESEDEADDADAIMGSTSADDLKDQERNFETFFMLVADLLLGEQETILLESGDWVGAMAVWGVLVEPGLKRDDLPPLLEVIGEKLPPSLDTTEQKAQHALCTGELTQALMSCYDMDIWLAAHLTDLLDKMALVDDDETAFEQHIRDYMVIEYADLLLSTPEYWNIACNYLATAGDVGIGRMRSVLLHVGLRNPLPAKPSAKPHSGEDDEMAVDEDGAATGEVAEDDAGHSSDLERVENVLRAAEEYRLEGVTKEICRIMSQRMLMEGRFGVAVSFSVRAGDRRQLRVITDAILDVYIAEGQEAYEKAVQSIPVSFLTGRGERAFLGLPPAYEKEDSISDTASFVTPFESAEGGLFLTTGLGFLLRFQHFLDAMAAGEKARAAELLGALFASRDVPKSFLAVLLMDSVSLLEDEEVLLSANDTFELMRQLEEITTGATYAPEQYLGSLYRLTQSASSGSSLSSSRTGRAKSDNRLLPSRMQQEKNKAQDIEGMQQALKGLDAVRLAAVRNLSRVSMMGLPVL